MQTATLTPTHPNSSLGTEAMSVEKVVTMLMRGGAVPEEIGTFINVRLSTSLRCSL